MNLLVGDVGQLKASSDQDAVKFANLGFKTLEDCDAWAKTHFKSRRYGLIMDPLLLLDRICRAERTTKDSTWKAMEGKVNMKITTGAEASALEALII